MTNSSRPDLCVRPVRREHQPRLFVFEGGDACGKATQSKLLANHLSTRIIDFPSYSRTPTGRVIDDLLHFSREDREALTKLFPRSAEDQPFARLLQSAMTWDRYTCTDLWEGPEEALVLDRYFMSGVVYGTLDGLLHDELLQAHKVLPAPRVAFLLDMPVDLQMQRLEGRGRVPDIFEAREGLRERLDRVRQGYRHLWTESGPKWWKDTHWVVLDATGSVEGIHQQVLSEVG